MESQPQNPEFRNNPENFHPCTNTEYDKLKYVAQNLKKNFSQIGNSLLSLAILNANVLTNCSYIPTIL